MSHLWKPLEACCIAKCFQNASKSNTQCAENCWDVLSGICGTWEVDSTCTRFKLDDNVRSRLINAMRTRSNTFKAVPEKWETKRIVCYETMSFSWVSPEFLLSFSMFLLGSFWVELWVLGLSQWRIWHAKDAGQILWTVTSVIISKNNSAHIR